MCQNMKMCQNTKLSDYSIQPTLDLSCLIHVLPNRINLGTVNSLCIELGYNELTAYIEVSPLP